MSLLIFFAVLFVLILVHEWGHYATARWTGMRVDEFGIGIPPKLFGWKKGEVEYTLNALPIGGFVKILGENGGLDLEGNELSEADRARAFGSRPKWAQAIVLIAGVTMNMLLAWMLFIATFMIGVPTTVDPESTSTENAALTVVGVLPDSPADGALPPGAVITAAASGDQMLQNLTPEGLIEFVTETAPEPLRVVYEHNNQQKIETITPAAGLNPENPEQYLLGINPAFVQTVQHSLFEAINLGTQQTISATQAIVSGIYNLIIDSVRGTADYSQIAGPVGIVGMVGDAAAIGIVALLTFTAFISINLAIINLLPIPALDGGRLVFVAIEAVTGKTIPPEWAGRVNLIGFVLLLLLMMVVTYSDIMKLIS